MSTFDLGPSAAAMTAVLQTTTDEELDGPTPCTRYRVGDLAEHVCGLAQGFLLAARKEPIPVEELREGDATYLVDGWREQVTADLAELADAWAQSSAREGTTWAGPVEMPAEEAGLVVLDELVVHGWDLAVATGQAYVADPVAVEACTAWVAGFDVPADDDDGGLFGPPVPVADDVPPLVRLLAMTGRDPAWSPPLADSR